MIVVRNKKVRVGMSNENPNNFRDLEKPFLAITANVNYLFTGKMQGGFKPTLFFICNTLFDITGFFHYRLDIRCRAVELFFDI
jgi:hypothetical protein